MDENDFSLDLKVDDETSTQLNDAAKWGKMFGIVVLAGFALFFVMMIAMWGAISKAILTQEMMEEGADTVLKYTAIIILLVALAITAILMNFLIRAGIGIRQGLQRRDQAIFNVGLANLRNYFTMYGVICILQLLFALTRLA